jgi:phosphatidylserine/phosphatidylglycerophosphate/cardiolipin synthase-like enzyme
LQSRIDEVDIQIVVADTDESQQFIQYFGPAVVRSLKNPYIHTKTMLIDDRVLMIGSINFSTNSLDNNRELSVIVTDTGAIQNYKHYFLQDWENSL